MNNSRPQDRSPERTSPIERLEDSFSARPAASAIPIENVALPGAMNDSGLVQHVITSGMKRSGLSRAEIADRMSYLAGMQVTEAMLNNFAAESRPDVRFPLQLARAFCAAVGDNQLLTCCASFAGLHFVDETGLHLMELGREFLKQKRAAENLQAIETKLRGVQL